MTLQQRLKVLMPVIVPEVGQEPRHRGGFTFDVLKIMRFIAVQKTGDTMIRVLPQGCAYNRKVVKLKPIVHTLAGIKMKFHCNAFLSVARVLREKQSG